MGVNEMTKAKRLAQWVRDRCKIMFGRSAPNMHDRVFQLMARGMSSGDAIDALQKEQRSERVTADVCQPPAIVDRPPSVHFDLAAPRGRAAR